MSEKKEENGFSLAVQKIKQDRLKPRCYLGVAFKENGKDVVYVGPQQEFTEQGVVLEGYLKFRVNHGDGFTLAETKERTELICTGKEELNLLAGQQLINYIGGEDNITEVLDYFEVPLTKEELKAYRTCVRTRKKREKEQRVEEKREKKLEKRKRRISEKERQQQLYVERPELKETLTDRLKRVGEEVYDGLRIISKGCIQPYTFRKDYDRELEFDTSLDGDEFKMGFCANFLISEAVGLTTLIMSTSTTADQTIVINPVGAGLGSTLMAWPIISYGIPLAGLAGYLTIDGARQKHKKKKLVEKQKARIKANICHMYER